ncbi:MAG: aldo/keto reductase [Phycisphaerales bacterium]
MQAKPFGETGLRVTPIGFGAAQIGYLERGQDEVNELVRRLHELGVNLLDTAAAYRESETLLGHALHADGLRNEFVLVTKVGPSVPDLDEEAWTPEIIRKSIERSLRRLRTDEIDVALLHSCDLEKLREGSVIEALVEAQARGQVAHIGYSGDNEAAEWATQQDAFAVLETSISVADQANIDGALRRAAARSMGVLAKRPIANAAWKNAADQPGFYGDYASDYSDRLGAMKVSPRDIGFVSDDASNWVEMSLRFTLAQTGVHSLIIGSTNADHVEDNVETARKGPLSEAKVERIRSSFRDAESASGVDWPGLT